MGSKGSNTTTTNTQSSPDPQAYQAYSQLLQQAGQVAQTPYSPYTGEGVAGINAQQTQGIGGVNQYANAAQPSIGAAMQQTSANSSPLTQAQIQQYMSPYTQDVVNATQAQFNNQNAQQQQGVVGNAIAQGALGGNRSAIAQSEMANQQQLAQAPVIAGLQNQGYQTGLATAQQQQQVGLQGASQLGNLGVAGQTAGLQGAGAQIGAGTLQQGTQQAQDTYNYNQYAQQQAYPFQTTQWLAGLDTGVGSQMGGTSTGQTTAPAPNMWSQILGGVTSGVGALGATGAFGGAGWLAPLLASDRHVKENIQAIGKLNDGQIIYRFNYKGDPRTQIGLMAQDVEKKKPDSVHEIGGVKHVDYKSATADAVKRAAGGVVGYASGGSANGVAPMPWAASPTWIPTSNIAHGSGAPHANAPAAFNPQPQSNDLSKQAASIGDLAKTLKDGVNGVGPAYGGGSAAAGDAYGGNSFSPLPGLSPSDYGQGYARGGVAGFAEGGGVNPLPNADDNMFLASGPDERVIRAKRELRSKFNEDAGERQPHWRGINAEMGSHQSTDIQNRVRGFADGGVPDDDSSSFDDRFAPIIPTMFKNGDPYVIGPKSKTTPVDDTPAPAKTDGVAVINPDEPYRLPDQASVDDWRAGVNNRALKADVGPKPDLPAVITKGVSDPSVPEDTGVDPSTRALGYSDSPRYQSQGVAPAPEHAAEAAEKPGFDWSGNSKLWPSLMSAGFGMLASRSPFFGVALGEGGQQGMGAYAQQQKAEADARNHAEQLALEHERLEKPYSEMTAAEKAADARAKVLERNAQMNQMVIPGPDGKPMVNPSYVAAHEAIEKSFKPVWSQIDELPSGQKIMGWTDPNTKAVYDASGKPYTPRGSGPPPPPPAPVTPGTPPDANVAPQPAAVPPNPNSSVQPAAPTAPPPGTPPTPTAAAQPPVQPAAAAAPHAPDPTAPVGSEASRNTAYLAEIAKQEPAFAAAVKKAADYELDPQKYASVMNGRREKFINAVIQYDPNFNPQDVGLRYQAQKAFLPGTKTGDTVRSFNTAVAHLDTLKELYNAVNNGDVKLFNKVKNEFQSQFGYAPPNTLNGIAQIVGGEVVKATVGSQNALGDREELRKTLDRDLSTMQATDVIDKFQSLMGGQLHSLKFAYEHGTGLHNFDEKYLLPRSQEVLRHIDAKPTAGGKPSLQDFLERARIANPKASDADLTSYYNQKYK